MVGGDICLPDRSGRIQLGGHVRDAPEGGGCLETNASHGRSEGRSSGGCKVMFLTESSGCSPGVGLLWTSLRPQHWLSRPWRPYLRHFKGFRLPIRRISRAVGLLQHPWGYPPSDDLDAFRHCVSAPSAHRDSSRPPSTLGHVRRQRSAIRYVSVTSASTPSVPSGGCISDRSAHTSHASPRDSSQRAFWTLP